MPDLASRVVMIYLFAFHISTANGLLAEEESAQLILHQFFSGIPKSCLKQSQPKKRTTSLPSCDARQQQENERQMLDNNMNDFVSFLDKLPSRYPQFIIKSNDDDVYMSLLNDTGSQVIQFL